jgi:transmembrane 9 superfamily member 2/4
MGLANRRWYLTCTLLSSLLLCADAFYLPGAAPHDYHQGEEVNLLVNALTPMLAGTDSARIVRVP